MEQANVCLPPSNALRMKYHGLDSIRSERVRPQLRSSWRTSVGNYEDVNSEPTEAEAKNHIDYEVRGSSRQLWLKKNN